MYASRRFENRDKVPGHGLGREHTSPTQYLCLVGGETEPLL